MTWMRRLFHPAALMQSRIDGIKIRMTRMGYFKLNSTQQATSKDGSQEERSSKSLIISQIL